MISCKPFRMSGSAYSQRRKIICLTSKNNELKRSIKDIDSKIQYAIEDAKSICRVAKQSKVCILAWEKVWEMEQAYHKKKRQLQSYIDDPLIEYCENFPEADECREYDV